MSMASWTSPRVSGRTLPISRVMSLEKSSLRCNSSSAARNMISARFGAGTSRHFLYASLAASTAWFASSSVPETNMPTSSSVFAGLRFSYALPLRDSTHSPLMKFLNIRGATDVAILPPQSPKLAALLFVWSPADLNARHYRAESKFYRCVSIRSNLSRESHRALKFTDLLVAGYFDISLAFFGRNQNMIGVVSATWNINKQDQNWNW